MDSVRWGDSWMRLGPRRGKKKPARSSSNGSSNNVSGNSTGFPIKQAVTAGCLALTGDTIAQLRGRWIEQRHKAPAERELWRHDWVRALTMASYGFLLYGPGSQAWYEFLDRALPLKTTRNLSIKVLLNQVVLGPCVILVIFAWNSLWQGKLRELPGLYQNKAVPTLVEGWKFWVPASVLNFSVIPLNARVAFMSCCSIFWNFYLSTTMRK